MKSKVLRVRVDKKARLIVPSGQARGKMTPMQKVEEDQYIIWGLLPDITGLIGINASASDKKPFNPIAEGHRSKPTLGSAVSTLDFLSQALFAAQGTDHIPLCLFFVVQILLDVFQITRYDNERAYSETSYTATNICRVLDQCSAFSQNIGPANWDSDPKNGQPLKDIQDFARKWILDEDAIGSYAQRNTLVDAESSYDLHGKSNLISGTVPTNPAEFSKKFSTVTGRHLVGPPTDDMPHIFTEAESVVKVLSYRYTNTHSHSSSHKQSPTQISHEGFYHILAQARAACEATQLNPSRKPRYPGRNHIAIAHETGNLTALGFLDTLCIAAEFEADSLVFDYLSLHMRCIALLKELHRECEAELRLRYGSGDVQKEALPLNFGSEEELCNLPYWIFKHDVDTGAQGMIWRAARVLDKYKFDTNIFISWLSEAARKNGHFLGNTRHQKPKRKPPNKKGKGKKAKAQPAPIFGLGELPGMAQLVVDSISEIPIGMLVALKHVIRARGECTEWFSRLDGGEEHKTSNETHRFALDIFKKVLEILLPQSAMQHQGQSRTETNLGEKNGRHVSLDLANGFEGLDVEDLPSGLEYISDVPIVKKLPVKRPERKYGIEEAAADYAMGVFFFFQDLNKVRDYLKSLWQDYRDGKVDLVSASVTTNCAFELIERNEEQLKISNEHFENGRFDYLDGAGVLLHQWAKSQNLGSRDFSPEIV
ncbi:hypothetical protein IFR05_009295 [Cadophora sp. M221]|nr:hypothetical protein IFR05_009295 [Cadophora sp. M221]